MKIKSVLLGVVIAAIILLLFVPLPATGVKIASTYNQLIMLF